MKESQSGNGEEKPGWPDSTYVMEEEEETHYMGSHWDPFFEDSSDFFTRIPEMLYGALLLTRKFRQGTRRSRQ